MTQKKGKHGPIESDVNAMAIWLGKSYAGALTEILDPHDITIPQYVILRILYLRDPDGQGISRGALEARAERDGPNVTRILDRLEGRGLVERFRTRADRRTVLARLTASGRRLNEVIETPLVESNIRQLRHMTRSEVETFAILLRKALHERTALGTANETDGAKK